MPVNWSLWLCFGSTMSALVGVLVLGWGARRERWRLLWVLIAALFLIGAGLGAAETVYQFSVEREQQREPRATPVSFHPHPLFPTRELS